MQLLPCLLANARSSSVTENSHPVQYEIPQILSQGSGAIVNTASVAGLIGGRGLAAYVASKHGVVGLTKTAALEYAQQGIQVNCVYQGVIQTPMTDKGLSHPERRALIMASEPMGRVGTLDLLYLSTSFLWWQAVASIIGVKSSHALRSHSRCTWRHREG